MQMQRFGLNKESLWGLVVSLSIGAPTYLIDVAVIYFALHRLELTEAQSVAAGFVVAAFFNYAMNRMYVYGNSRQPHMKAMLYYFGIAFLWFWFTVGATVFLSHQFHFEYRVGHLDITQLFVARTIVGIFVGVAGFVISSLITFKIPTRSE